MIDKKNERKRIIMYEKNKMRKKAHTTTKRLKKPSGNHNI